MPISLQQLPLWAELLVFAASAVAVWSAGTRLAGLVDALARRTGLGHAFTGMLLLGGITSLPELAAVTTSASIGNAPLAVNNLLGTASINVLLLAIADALYGRGALTVVAATPSTLMQGVLSMLLLALVAAIAASGDFALPALGLGAGSLVILAATAGALWFASRYNGQHSWVAVGQDKREKRQQSREFGDWSTRWIVVAICASAAVILVSGFFLSLSADAVAQDTGLASGLVGFVLIAAATSLPEISSITAAVRLRNYEMAIGDIFGTNIFNMSLLVVADVAYRGGPVLATAGRFEITGGLLALLMTGIVLIGLLERENRTVLRMGYDSVASILLFACGLGVLSTLS